MKVWLTNNRLIYSTLTYNGEQHNGEIEDVPRILEIFQTQGDKPDNSFQKEYSGKNPIGDMYKPSIQSPGIS